MNLMILCGCLEPGCDGVGDYSRGLARELIRQNLTVAIIALNDKHVSKEEVHTELFEDRELQVIRIPSSWRQSVRFRKAKEWIIIMNPEWLSLQYVIFSFHPKGLPFTSNYWLRWLGEGRRWHIMFHELWVGMDINSSKKLLWWGKVQKLLIKRLLIKISPAKIHTQTRLYQDQLSRLGFQVEYLPLFGSIPVLRKAKIFSDRTSEFISSKKEIRLVIFGSIHSGAPVEEFASDVSNYSKENQVSVTLTIIGRTGREHHRWAYIWKSAGLQLEVLGEQSPMHISKVLSNASLGISTTPFALAEKSSAIAAMQEHGLEVLCVSYPWRDSNSRVLQPPPGIIAYNPGNLKNLSNSKKNAPPMSKISAVAAELTHMVRSK